MSTPKTWNEMKSSNSWLLFKIMGEFVNGFEQMGMIEPCQAFTDVVNIGIGGSRAAN